MQKLTFWQELWRRFRQDEVQGMAAELSYFFLLSLFPFLLFIVTLIGFLPISSDVVLEYISEYAPGNSMEIIEENLTYITNQHNEGLLSLTIIGTLVAASNGINAIIRAFNRAYEVNENRSFIKARLMSIFLTVLMVFVIIIALLLPVFGKNIGVFIFSVFGLSDEFLVVWNALRWGVSFLILFIVFTCLYFVAPNKRLHIRNVTKGALFATIGWILVSSAFSLYVNLFGNFTATYGSLGGVIVLMIWFYLSGMIIIIGGEINAILYYRSLEK
ncbi:YihY/virulence factor BrkB family protein [Bacillus sp. HMF5848]|uniref:YihY/virulence factor BrkB family protein n=1 Tax=Bacillus sp. HMF5848 TaxID=2495421 RepID=UPI000F7B7695|nr:YihY/virulence factor BrkB family protein [Bacillus sp. HMF5848]RSK29240.1 YihY/virulence factor BrkB family protein [Bacillus sp. HMF5848]